jgi:UDP:flavonoid glycosyltransferase YjiC (YdhE family)
LTILFYAIGAAGLGHLSRTLGIADTIRRIAPEMPEIPIIFVTEASDSRLLNEYPFPYYQVPRYRIHSMEERWRALPEQQVRHVWEQTVKSIVDAHQPSVIVHDTFIRKHLHQLAVEAGSREVLILRKRTDTRSFLHKNRHVLSSFGLIAVPHHEEEIGNVKPSWLAEDQFMYCGPLLRRTRSDLRVEEIRQQYCIKPDEFTIVISNGDGNILPDLDDEFIEITLKTLKALEDQLPAFQAIVITGPLAPPYTQWVSYKAGQLIVRDFESNLLDLFAASNLAITRGGYNTMLELLEIGIPAICIPAKRHAESQAQRIERTTRETTHIRAEVLKSDALGKAIIALASQPWWHYQPNHRPDRILANKQFLARRILSLLP